MDGHPSCALLTSRTPNGLHGRSGSDAGSDDGELPICKRSRTQAANLQHVALPSSKCRNPCTGALATLPMTRALANECSRKKANSCCQKLEMHDEGTARWAPIKPTIDTELSTECADMDGCDSSDGEICGSGTPDDKGHCLTSKSSFGVKEEAIAQNSDSYSKEQAGDVPVQKSGDVCQELDQVVDARPARDILTQSAQSEVEEGMEMTEDPRRLMREAANAARWILRAVDIPVPSRLLDARLFIEHPQLMKKLETLLPKTTPLCEALLDQKEAPRQIIHGMLCLGLS